MGHMTLLKFVREAQRDDGKVGICIGRSWQLQAATFASKASELKEDQTVSFTRFGHKTRLQDSQSLSRSAKPAQAPMEVSTCGRLEQRSSSESNNFATLLDS